MSAIRRLILCAVPLVSLSISGCATLIEAAIPERATHSLSGAPQILSVPHASAQPSSAAYESPIPKWNSAYRGVSVSRLGERRVARALDIVDAVRVMAYEFQPLGGGSDAIHITPLSVLFCRSGLPQNREKNWWGNTFSLQPGGLAIAVVESQLKSRCETSYLRSH